MTTAPITDDELLAGWTGHDGLAEPPAPLGGARAAEGVHRDEGLRM